jgi:hypothetical protein
MEVETYLQENLTLAFLYEIDGEGGQIMSTTS